MSTYHLSVKPGKAAKAGEHAKYIAREDHYAYISRGGKYEVRGDLKMSESGNMPAWAQHDPSIFWQAADQYERVNGRPYREIEVSLPRELNDEQRVELVREFVANTIGDRHAYSWAIHNPTASDGLEQPHAHIMFTERVNDGIARDPEQFFKRWNRENPEKGGAGKDRYLATRQFVVDVREEWAMTANHFMARHGIEARIDHRSYKALGIELEPSLKVGIARYAGERGVMENVLAENRARARRNGERLLINPAIGVHALTATKSMFSRRDVEQFVFRNTDGEEQFRQVYARMMNSKELIALSVPGKEGEWFTSTELHHLEKRLVDRAERLSTAAAISVDDTRHDPLRMSRKFNAGQDEAFSLLTSGRRFAIVNGAAGTGKSYVLKAAREALEADGFRVIGAALQGKTADDMERDSGIRSRTLHSLLGSLDKGSLKLDDKTIVFVDEAGMVGSRQMEKLLEHVERSGALIRMVGDAYQIHAVDAGDAFRAVSKMAESVGALASLTEIKRQKEEWQRQASEALSRHEISAAITAYADHGSVQLFDSLDVAREMLVLQFMADRDTYRGESQILLTHTNAQRDRLNSAIRSALRDRGELGADQVVQMVQVGDDDSGERDRMRTMMLAPGERVMFLRNDYDLDVKNGTLATIESVAARETDSAAGSILTVRLDDGRKVAVDTANYGALDYGYALTVHKSQGMTVDRAYVLATKSLHAELAYVAMTRHKTSLTLASGKDEFADARSLSRSLARPDEKSFSAYHGVRPETELGPEYGYRHTLAIRRSALAESAPVRRRPMSLETAVSKYVDALTARQQARSQDRPLHAKDRALLKRSGAALEHIDPAIRRRLAYLASRDDRAWKALVALSGHARAQAVVEQLRQQHTTRVEHESERQPRKPYAGMSAAERAAARAAYMSRQRHAADRAENERATESQRKGRGIRD
ncbi:AAA family ATPase [Burkholderia multivorans]|uniref:AAA family ATPase n=1 Tax=Burkholderia multivorans TaxID=87883 RepID=UPI0021C16CAF|nr:AAA family ATPase [Burkholderia multivorans]